jgi:ATP-dependent DNA helicase RecQ
MVIFLEERLDEKSLFISREIYQTRKLRYTERAEAMLAYAENNAQCRSQILLAYFGETDAVPCGECDVCRSKDQNGTAGATRTEFREKILQVIAGGPCTLDELSGKTAIGREMLVETVRYLLDNNYIQLSDDGILTLDKGNPA